MKKIVLFLVLVFSTGSVALANTPIKVGHLSYHSGPFGDFGPWFDGITNFTLDVINENPPLGRSLNVIHQDAGTIGEAEAAKTLIQDEKVDILLNPAHAYDTYRTWMKEHLQANDSPLMPSVHGGGISKEIGGVAEEPIFRGAPMDTGQATAAVLKAKEEGSEKVVIVATDFDGSQLQLEAATHAANMVGLNVVEKLSVAAEQASYLEDIDKIGALNPDTVLIFSQAQDGGTLVKELAEAGLSLTIIGTTEWMSEAFPETATDLALELHKAVWVSGFSFVDGPAYAYYEPKLKASKYVDIVNELSNSYNIQYYDVLVVTALAIEKAGSTEASKWAEQVRNVAMGPGKKVHTYEEGIKAIRAGEEIDYSGLTGEFDYSATGTVSGLYGIFEWQAGELVKVGSVDGKAVLDNDI